MRTITVYGMLGVSLMVLSLGGASQVAAKQQEGAAAKVDEAVNKNQGIFPNGFVKGKKEGWKGDAPSGWEQGKKTDWDGGSKPPGHSGKKHLKEHGGKEHAGKELKVDKMKQKAAGKAAGKKGKP